MINNDLNPVLVIHDGNQEAPPLVENARLPSEIFFAVVGAAAQLGTLLMAEFNRAVTDLSQSTYTCTLVDIFQRATAGFAKQRIEGEAETTEEEILPGYAMLKREVQKLPKSTLITEATPPPFSNPKELRALSLLKHRQSEISLDVDQGLISLLTARGASAHHEAVPTLLSKLKGFFPSREGRLWAFQAASEREKSFCELIKTHRETTDQTARAVALHNAATDLARDLLGVPLGGTPYLFYGEVSRPTAAGVPDFATKLLSDHIPEDFRGLLTGDTTALEVKLRAKIAEALESGGVSTEDSLEALKKAQAAIKGSLDRCDRLLEHTLPEQWHAAVVNSLKEDLRELAVGARSKEGQEKLFEKIWDQLLEKGIEQAVEDSVTELLAKGKGVAQGAINNLQDGLRASLPPTMVDCLSAAGYHLGSGDPFTLEFTREVNGTYTIRVYSKEFGTDNAPAVSGAGLNGYRNPMVIQGVRPQSITVDFCTRLLSFRAWPQWGTGMSYTLNDLHEMLMQWVFAPREAPNAANVIPEKLTHGGSSWDWLKRYLYSKDAEVREGYDKLFHFDIPLAVLINFWPQLEGNPALKKRMAAQIHQLVSGLSQNALSLYAAEKISYDELKVVFATVWEIREEMRPEAQPNEATYASAIVPKSLQGHVKQLFAEGSLSPRHIASFKEACVAVMGPEVKTHVDQILEDIIPEIPTKPKLLPRGAEVSWQDILRIPTLKSYADQLRTMRPSLLHGYRAYATVSKLMGWSIGYSACTKLVDCLLQAMFPQLKALPYFSSRRIAQVIVFFGPGVLKKVVPEDVFRALYSVIGIISDLVDYVMRRCMILVLGVVSKQLLSKKQVDELNGMARNWQQQLTRKGKIRLAPPSRPLSADRVQHVKLPLIPPAVDISDDDDSPSSRLVDETDASSSSNTTPPATPKPPPRPEAVKITAANACQVLRKWNNDSIDVVISKAEGSWLTSEKRQVFLYLNEQLRDLPIPGCEGGEIWDEIDDPERALEYLAALLRRVCRYQSYGATFSEVTESVVSSHALYAVIDYLARKCPKAEIPSALRPNGRALRAWLQQSGSKAPRRRTVKQLYDVAHYFGLMGQPPKERGSSWLTMGDRRIFDGHYSFVREVPEDELELFTGSNDNLYSLFPRLNAPVDDPTGHYYRSLLRKPEVRRRLELHGVTDDTPHLDQLSLLYRDPSLKQAKAELKRRQLAGRGFTAQPTDADLAERQALKDGLSESCDPGDQRKGILPRAFCLLREAYLQTENISRVYDDKLASIWVKSGITMEPVRKRSTGPEWWKNIKKSFHQKTNQNFNTRYFSSIFPLHPRWVESDSLWRRRVSIVNSGHCRIASRSPEDRKIAGEDWLRQESSRSQSEIMHNPLKPEADCTHEEWRLLEMINTDRWDQIPRCLSFFTNSRHRLAEHKWATAFELLVTELLALDAQLKQRKEYSKDIGRFFKESLDYFQEREDWSTYLFLCKVGVQLRSQCGSLTDTADKDFPDFAARIRNDLEPKLLAQAPGKRPVGDIAEGLGLSLFHQLTSYVDSHPDIATEKEKEEILLTLGRIRYRQFGMNPGEWCSELPSKAEEIHYRWESELLDAIEINAEFRKKLLNQVMVDAGLPPGRTWFSNFPYCTNGTHIIDLSKRKPSVDICDHTKAFIFHAKLILGKPLEEVEIIDSTHLRFPQSGCTAELVGNEVVVHRMVNGERYRLLTTSAAEASVFHTTPSQRLWLRVSDGTPLILKMDGEQVLQRMHVEEDAGKTGGSSYQLRYMELPVDGEWLEPADLAGTVHQMALLSWFQSYSDIKVWARNKSGERKLARIDFPQIGHKYRLDDQGKAFNVDGSAPGYYISETQRIKELNGYPQYLLLENAVGERKVQLIKQPWQQLMGTFTLQELAGFDLSPLMEKQLTEMLQGATEEPSAYTYSLDRNGRLHTEDPQAMLYLVLFHLAHGDREACEAYFAQMEDWGHRNPFPKEMLPVLDKLLIPLLFSQKQTESQLALRLAAIREENVLAHQQEMPPKSEMDLLRWVGVQFKYKLYLDGLDAGAAAVLSQDHELFILKSIGRQAIKTFRERFGDTLDHSAVGTLVKKMGLENLASHMLMHPKLAGRYNTLRGAHADGSRWEQRYESLLLHSATSAPSPHVDLVPSRLIHRYTRGRQEPAAPVVQGASTVTKVIHSYQRCAKSKQVPSEAMKEIEYSVLSRLKLEELPVELSQLTPRLLKENFLGYYRLASRGLPEDWRGDQEKERFFAENAYKLAQSLHFMIGECKGDVKATACINALRAVADTGVSASSLVTADTLDALYQKGGRAAYQRFMEERVGKEVTDLEFSCLIEGSAFDIGLLMNLGLGEDDPHPRDAFRDAMQAIFDYGSQRRYGSILSVAAEHALPIVLPKVIELTQDYLPPERRRAQAQDLRSTAGRLGDTLAHGTIGLRKLALAQDTINMGLRLWSTGKAILERERDVRTTHEALVSASQVDSESKLNDTLAAKMTQREGAITRVMDGLLGEYFTVETLDAPTIDPVDPYDLGDGEAAVRAGFDKLNKSLFDYYHRPQPTQKRYQLKAGKSAEALGRDLTQLRAAVAKRLEKERAYIERYANHAFQPDETEEASIKRRLMIGSKVARSRLDFAQIDRFFIQDRDMELLDRTTMSAEHLPHLKERLYLYHVLASRWNLLFDRIQGLTEPTEAALSTVGQELDRRRVYDFEDAPQRLVRGKLIFESRTRKMLWSKQSSQIDRMLLSPQQRLVVELIMGSGKTWYGIPETDFFGANGDQIMINIWPAAVAPTNIAGIGRQSLKVLSQVANALQLSRGTHWVKDKLWAIKRLFERTRLQRQQMNMTKESLQAFELCFIEQALKYRKDGKKDTDVKDSLRHFIDTLGLIRRKGKGNIDEAHVAFSKKKELNHPVGARKRLPEKYLPIMEDALFLLVNSPECADVLSVKGAKPAPLDRSVYDERVLPVLAEKVAELPDLEVPASEKEAFIAYISGQADAIPAFVKSSELKSELALAKGLLTVLLPAALEKTMHVDYGCSKEGNGQFARPSEGNGNTQEQSSIRSPFEAFVKSGLLILHDRLENKQLDRLIHYLQAKAKLRSKAQGIPLENTAECAFFRRHCPGYKLFGFKESDRANVRALLNKSDRAVLAYLRIFVSKEIRYFENNLSSNSSNFASMFASFFSDTGTPYNDGCYPTGTEVLYDAGTDGESVDIMEKKASHADAIQVLEAEAPEEALDELITRLLDSNKSATALIDRGAVFNGMESTEVAKKLLDYICIHRPELEAVAFYHKGELLMWEKTATKPVPFSQSTVPAGKRLSYFPQPQTFAADIPQPEGATGIVTVGEDLEMNELAQAIWRMRGLKRSDQKLVFAMTPKVAKKIAGDRKPTIRDIIRFAQANQERSLAEDSFHGDSRHKLHNVVRRAVLDKALAADADQAADIIFEFQDVFVSKLQDDPYYLFGLLDVEVTPAQVFRVQRRRYFDLIRRSNRFSRAEKAEIWRQLEAIGHGRYPNKVHSYSDGKSIDATRLDDLGMESHVDVSQDEEADEEMENQQELQQQLAQIEVQGSKRKLPQEHYPWRESLKITDLDSWLTVTTPGTFQKASSAANTSFARSVSSFFGGCLPGTPPIFKVKDVLASLGTEEADAVASKFSNMIFATNNVTHLRARNGCPVEPFGQEQIPLQEALVVKDRRDGKSGRVKIILVDAKEAAYWRRKLKRDRKSANDDESDVSIGLYDIGTRSLVAEGRRKFDADELNRDRMFQRSIIQLKFLRGDVLYAADQRDRLKAWMKASPKMMPFFEGVHKHHCRNKLCGSDLERIAFETESLSESQAVRI